MNLAQSAGPVQQPDCVGVESRGRGPGRYCPSGPSDHPHSSHGAGCGVNGQSVGAAGPVEQLEG